MNQTSPPNPKMEQANGSGRVPVGVFSGMLIMLLLGVGLGVALARIIPGPPPSGLAWRMERLERRFDEFRYDLDHPQVRRPRR